MEKLQGKIAVVTAATKGIGLASAEILAKNGATVYLAARSEELANEVINKISAEGGCAKFVYFNAREEETFTSMIEEVVKKEGKIDILVNNFGSTNPSLDKDLVTGDTDNFFDTVNTNLKSVYLPCKAAIPHMIKNGKGSIVNISSIGSVLPDLSRIAYCVSKAAINSLTQNIATQYAKDNVRCNAALDNMSPEFIKEFLKHVPLNRIGEPDDIAKAVLFYASDDSSFITGDLLEVAGGFGLPTPQFADNILG